MGNCKSSLFTSHFEIDLKDREGIKKSFWNFLNHDGDLTENEDYFQDDTLELGYEDEAERIIDEITKDKKMDTLKSFKAVWDVIFDVLYSQEYWGECSYDIIEVGDGKYIVYYAIGGRSDWDR